MQQDKIRWNVIGAKGNILEYPSFTLNKIAYLCLKKALFHQVLSYFFFFFLIFSFVIYKSKIKMVMDYVSSAKSVTKLKGQDLILHSGSGGWADHPRPSRGMIFPMLGRKRSVDRSCNSQILSNQTYNL